MSNAKEKVVVSVGGSVIFSEDSESSIKDLAELFKSLSQEFKLFIVVGGGKTSRYYIELGRELGLPEKQLDEMGIAVTRLNARLLSTIIGEDANQVPPETVEAAAELSDKYHIVIMGGTTPGHTTDAVAVMLAEKVKATKLVNATSVDGIYSADPKKDTSAKRFEKLSYRELVELTKEYEGFAGPNVVFDPIGAKIVEQTGITLLVVKGTDLDALRNAIEGKEFHGTIVG